LPIFSHRPTEKAREEVDKTKTAAASSTTRALDGICVVCRYRVIGGSCNVYNLLFQTVQVEHYLITFNSFGSRNSALG
jgi:hypothetical protein